MGKAEILIALDSNCYTYVLDAMSSVTAAPIGGDADEKIALLHIYFYHPTVGAYWLSDRVVAEYERMPESPKRDFHSSTKKVLFCSFPRDLDVTAINRRATDLLAKHNYIDDCTVLAECEAAGMDYLLTYDKYFLKRLAPVACGTKVMRPSVFWESLQVEKGSKPVAVPHPTNPLSQGDWWRW
jgi:hypothetical protein